VWAECGHEVFFGARNLEKKAAKLSHHSTRYGTASWKRILSQSNERNYKALKSSKYALLKPEIRTDAEDELA